MLYIIIIVVVVVVVVVILKKFVSSNDKRQRHEIIIYYINKQLMENKSLQVSIVIIYSLGTKTIQRSSEIG